MFTSRVAPSGVVTLKKFPSPKAVTLGDIIRWGLPSLFAEKEVNIWRIKNIPNLWRGVRTAMLARFFGIPTHYGVLFLKKFAADGRIVEYGLASMRVVTDNGVGFVVDAFQNLKELENMKFHGFGVGTTAEAAADSALVTELTTEYATNNTRPTGSQGEGATGNIYSTVATLTPDSAVAITEHGIFDQAANSGGVLLDRTKFSAVNLNGTGDSLQATYQMTYTSGS